MKSTLPWALCVCAVLADRSFAVAQSSVALSGSVVNVMHQPIERADVTIVRQGTPTVVKTAAGQYRIELAAGGDIDYVIFEHPDYVPKVIAGPLSGKLGGQINVVMISRQAKVASPPAALGVIQSVQFLNLILKRPEKMPANLTIQSQLTVALSGLGAQDKPGAPQSPVRGSGVGEPKHGLWGMEDEFFSAAGGRP